MKKNNNYIVLWIIIIFLVCCIIGLVWPSEKLITVTDSMSPRLEPVYPDVTVKLVQDSMDTVRNPYAPPLRYNEPTYAQLGYLSKGSTKYILFGKPAHYGRDKWYYYTIINDIKLPLEINKRKCTSSQGCDSVSTKDKVIVDGEEYIVTMYDTDLLCPL
jgi:hypothetical protein